MTTPFTELMRTNHDWKARRWSKEIEIRKMAKRIAYEELGFMVPTFESHQVIDGKRRTYLQSAPNFILFNWFNFYAMGLQSVNLATANVTPAAVVATMYYPYGSGTLGIYFAAQVLANQQLGTDTSTASTRKQFKLTAAITHTAPTSAVTNTNALSTYSSTNFQQVSQSQVGYTFAAASTSGNPTMGELGAMQSLANPTPALTTNLTSRLAVADGLFTSFTINSAAALLVNWILTYPTA